MKKILQWIKNNKLSTGLLIIILIIILSTKEPTYKSLDNQPSTLYNTKTADIGHQSTSTNQNSHSNSTRKIITNSNLSIKVKNVTETVTKINQLATQYGGFLVNSSISTPEFGSTGNISVRVESDQLETFTEEVKTMGVKVVNEFIQGYDITDQYTDSKEKLRILETTKIKFEQILEQADEVEDMLETQRQLLNIQDEIDQIKGQIKALDQKSKLSLVTIYLSTDELELPTVPGEPWRPKVVFREASRSFIRSTRAIAGIIIWIGVYTPIWLTIAIVIKLWKIISKKRKTISN